MELEEIVARQFRNAEDLKKIIPTKKINFIVIDNLKNPKLISLMDTTTHYVSEWGIFPYDVMDFYEFADTIIVKGLEKGQDPPYVEYMINKRGYKYDTRTQIFIKK